GPGAHPHRSFRGVNVQNANADFIPIIVLLAVAVAFLWLHFTGGSGLTRLYLGGALTLLAVLILLPSLQVPLPDWWVNAIPTPKIQLGLDLQGGSHLLLEVKLDDAVKTALKRRGVDLQRELTSNKIAADISQEPSGAVLVRLKDPAQRSQFLDLFDKLFNDLTINQQNGAYVLNF